MGLEVGGYFSTETYQVLWELAGSKARSAPEFLQVSSKYVWFRRWSMLLDIAAQTVFIRIIFG